MFFPTMFSSTTSSTISTLSISCGFDGYVHQFHAFSPRPEITFAQTSRVYYFLSQHSIVWKRLIQRTTLPLPPFPPTSNQSLHELSASEAERLMARAAAVDRLWRMSPQMCESKHLDSFWRIEEMKLLPGSHYLVASATDTTRTQWGIVLYTLGSQSDSVPIARMPTKSKAYNLDVKYMTLDGVPGITVTFIRRAYTNSRQRRHG